MTDASTTGAVERLAPYAVDGGCDAYGQMESDPFGDYVRFEDYVAAIKRANDAEAQAALAWEAGRDAAAKEAWAVWQGLPMARGVDDAARRIAALTPPADLSAALTARLDAEWNAAIEAAAFASGDGEGRAGLEIRALRRAAPTEGEA